VEKKPLTKSREAHSVWAKAGRGEGEQQDGEASDHGRSCDFGNPIVAGRRPLPHGADLRFPSEIPPAPRRPAPLPLQSGCVNDHSLPKTSGRRRAPFRLGDLEVRPESGEVIGPRGTVRLRPLLVEILVRLAAEPAEVVRRETLLEEVWPRRMVNDEVLSRAIAELRTALGDDARAARYVETLPKIGYRLAAPVAPVEATAPPKPTAPSPRAASAAWPVAAVVVVLAGAALALWAPWRTSGAADLGPRLACGARLHLRSGDRAASPLLA
jgi:DNA-binding winged helix-turn-helix (wHTH) protein